MGQRKTNNINFIRKRLILPHSTRDFSPWSLDPIILNLWWHKTLWQEDKVEKTYSHPAKKLAERDGGDTVPTCSSPAYSHCHSYLAIGLTCSRLGTKPLICVPLEGRQQDLTIQSPVTTILQIREQLTD